MPSPDLQGTRNAGIEPETFYFADAGRDSIGQSIGRGIFAGRDYEASTEIYTKPRMLAATLKTEHRKNSCANCYAWRHPSSLIEQSSVEDLQRCAGCRVFLYCNKTCQAQHWKRIHKFQCKALKEMQEQLPPSALEVALRQVLQVTMEIVTRRAHGKIPDHQWNVLCDLPTHSKEFSRSEFEVPMVEILGAYYRFTELRSYSIDFVFEMYTRVRTNSLSFMTPDNVETGMWIDEIISQINHSCDPNAILITDGPRVSLRTLKDIKKDEQIFIAYTEPTDPYFYRQRQLKDKFFFTCRCAKCERGDPISEDSSASWPNGPPPEFREKVAQLLKERHGLRMNTTDASQEELKSVLQEKAFELCGRPDVVVLEEVDYYYHPALWPVYQQPFVILSENLISNLLSVARFMDAWKHCGIHYWKIWPKFYKQKAHPHRVVSVYKFARLAAYLSQRGATIDDHMFAISVALTVEAKELAVLSHGENNTFTRHVQEEYRRMFADDSLSPKYWEQLEQEKLEWRDLVEREYDMSYRRGPYSI